jgi:hypothetical protein
MLAKLCFVHAITHLVTSLYFEFKNSMMIVSCRETVIASINTFPAFHETEDSLPSLQNSVTGLSPDPDEASLHLSTLFL